MYVMYQFLFCFIECTPPGKRCPRKLDTLSLFKVQFYWILNMLLFVKWTSMHCKLVYISGAQEKVPFQNFWTRPCLSQAKYLCVYRFSLAMHIIIAIFLGQTFERKILTIHIESLQYVREIKAKYLLPYSSYLLSDHYTIRYYFRQENSDEVLFSLFLPFLWLFWLNDSHKNY